MSARILDALVAANKVPLYLDFRTGSLRDLGGMGNHPTVTNCVPVTAKGRRGVTCYPNGTIECADTASLRLSQLSIVALMNNSLRPELESLNPRVCSRTNNAFAAANWDLAHATGANNLFFQAFPAGGSTAVAMTDAMWASLRTVGFAWTGGNAGRFYMDASLLGPGNSNVPAVATGAGYTVRGFWVLPGTAYKPPGNHALVLVNEQLDDADMCRLMRELEAAPGVVARQRNHFSIPYPSKTPAQYAADSCVLDTSFQKAGAGFIENALGNNFTTSPVPDKAEGGPFESAIRLDNDTTIVTGAAVPLAGNFLTVSTRFNVLAGDQELVRSATLSTTVGSFGHTIDTGRLFLGGRQAGGFLIGNTAAIPTLWNQWLHTHMLYDATQPTPATQLRLFINGVEYTPLAYPLTEAPSPVTDQVVYVGSRGAASLFSRGKHASVKLHTRILSPAEIRAEYLLGARKCLLDGRLHRDGSCPVSLANVTSVGADVVPGLWKLTNTGGFGARVAEPNGERLLQVDQLIQLSGVRNESEFGSWYFRWLATNGQPRVVLASNSPTYGAATNQLGVQLAGAGTMYLYTLTPGVTILDTYVLGVNTGDWEVWATRRYDGYVQVWMRGTGLPAWAMILEGTTVASFGPWQWLINDSNTVSFGDFMHFLGEMTPGEAQALGLIE
jgi:hypothetical protein